MWTATGVVPRVVAVDSGLLVAHHVVAVASGPLVVHLCLVFVMVELGTSFEFASGLCLVAA